MANIQPFRPIKIATAYGLISHILKVIENFFCCWALSSCPGIILLSPLTLGIIQIRVWNAAFFHSVIYSVIFGIFSNGGEYWC